MSRRKLNKLRLVNTYGYRYIIVVLVGILLFAHIGPEILANINLPYFVKETKEEQLVGESDAIQENQSKNDSEIAESQLENANNVPEAGELEHDNGSTADQFANFNDNSGGEEIRSLADDSIDKASEQDGGTSKEKRLVEVLPALSDLFNDGVDVNVGESEVSWNYSHDSDGGTLTLLKPDDFILQNKADGTPDSEIIPMHIIVTPDANNSNIILNNLNIKRPDRLNSNSENFAKESPDNAPLFISALNITIRLNDGTENRIDATDSLSVYNRSQRSAIYLNGEKDDAIYTLKIEGEGGGSGRLLLNSAGINTYSVPTTTSNIVITSGIVEIDINGAIRVGIGGVSNRNGSSDKLGNLQIEIAGGEVTVNAKNTLANGVVDTIEINAPAIGSGYSNGSIGDVVIKISGDANVAVNMDFQNFDADARQSINVRATAIGVGRGNRVASFLVEIVDNPIVNVRQLVKGLDNAGSMFYHGASIGGSYDVNCAGNFTIDIKGGQFALSQVIEVGRTVVENDSTSSMRPAIIGLGYVNTVSGKITINVSAGDLKLENKFIANSIEGKEIVGQLIPAGTGIGGASSVTFTNLDINLTGGNIAIKLIVETDNSELTLDANGAGIGVAYGDGSKANSETNININGVVTVDVQGGYSGIGTASDSLGTVKVNISENASGEVPDLIVTARRGQAINENRGSGETNGVIFSQFDLGAERTGENWLNWDDGANKDMLILLEDTNGQAGRDVLRRINFIGNIRGVAYTLPVLHETAETRVKMVFTNDQGMPITGYFKEITREDRVIVANNTIFSEEVVFVEDRLPALWTLHEGRENITEDTWRYTHDSVSNTGTLRLLESGFFVLRNNEIDEGPFKPEAPINIIVEATATGSAIIMDNMDIVRSASSSSTIAYHQADSEQIAPFTIKAADTTIYLNPGSKNKINGEDTLLEGAGYRAALYMYAGDSEKEYNLQIKQYDMTNMWLEDEASSSVTNRALTDTSFTTVNGGINALGVDGSTINMSLIDDYYNLNAVSAYNNYAVAFGGGYTSEPVSNFSLNLNLDNLKAIRAIGHSAAIGHNDGIGTSNLNVVGEFELEAFAFSSGSAIASTNLPNSAIVFTTVLAKEDNWQHVIIRPYVDEVEDWWELSLPESSSYPAGSEHKLSIVYSNPEFDAAKIEKPFERMSLRIASEEQLVYFLADELGTGSTLLPTAIIDMTSNNVMLPSSSDLNIDIPDIVLTTDLSEGTLTMPNDESRKVINHSRLPLMMSYRGYVLTESPEGIDDTSFAQSPDEFQEVNGNEDVKLLLQLAINKADESGDVNFADGQQVQTLFPKPSDPEAAFPIATLRGINADVTSAVELRVDGKFTEALRQMISGEFSSKVNLRWSLLEFVQFE